jgi:hypothetical protein
LPGSAYTGVHAASRPGADSCIARVSGAVTAFIGRTLRGPVNRPVRLKSFAEYQQVFGGLWQPSPLSYSVEQFFDGGGREAVVVRVANGGARATIVLPAGREQLVLQALSPGSREALRASVDYDNVAAHEEDCFNLVVQRVRTRGSEFIEDQEIFRRVSIRGGTARCVRSALMESKLVRLSGDLPTTRPNRTFRPGSRHPIGYVECNTDGHDGAALTDYDLIGSPERRTGLFALGAAEDIDFLCLPPLERDRDVGPSALMVAAQFCRNHHLLLLVDPPAEWDSCGDALTGLRELAFHSEQAVMCFPRIRAYDRLRGRYERFSNCGAVAAALCRMEQHRPLWQPGPDDELLLRPGTRPARVLSETERIRLIAHGINPIQSLRSANPRRPALRTLAGGSGRGAASDLLGWQRRSLAVVKSIDRGTRWAVLEAHDPSIRLRLARQVEAFLRPLCAAGLFGDSQNETNSRVICDDRINSAEDVAAGRVSLLVTLCAPRAGEQQSFLITHSPEGSRIRRVKARLLPRGTRMSVGTARGRVPGKLVGDPFRRQREPRLPASARSPAGDAESAAAGRGDLDLVGRFHRDFGGRSQLDDGPVPTPQQVAPGSPGVPAGESERRDATMVGQDSRRHGCGELDAAQQAVPAAVPAVPT